MAKEPFPSDKQDKFMLRLPEGMRENIKLAAELNNRSMNSEIVSRLEASFMSRADSHDLLKEVQDMKNGMSKEELAALDFAAEMLTLLEVKLKSFRNKPD